MNYWLKMAKIRELFEEKHPLNYFVMESPAGQEFVRIHGYDCLGMGWSDDDYYLDHLLYHLEGCKSDDEVDDMLHWLASTGRRIHVQHSATCGQDWDEARAATLPHTLNGWGWCDLSDVMNR